MKKSERIESLFKDSTNSLFAYGSEFPNHFELYVQLFNRHAYYEAHDVLEILWLKNRQSKFLKGLIQSAGAFVHLQKHFQHPAHPKHSRRLRPARALLQLALQNLGEASGCSLATTYFPIRLQAISISRCWTQKLDASPQNPWSPSHAPQLAPPNPCLNPTSTS